MLASLRNWIGAGRRIEGTHPSNPATVEMFGTPTASGANVSQETSMNLSAVYCAVNLISDAIKALPLFTYRRLDNGGKEPAREHPVYRLLHRAPNPEMSPSRFKKLMTAWALLWGSGRAEIERNGFGQPIALWPIHPSRVYTVRDDNGDLVHRVFGPGGAVDIPDHDVLNVMGLSDDGLSGLSVVAKARESLGIASTAENYAARFYKNNAVPPAYLTTPNRLRPEGRKQLRNAWQGMHGGSRNVGKMALLDNGIEIKTLSMPHEDAQFLETRAFQIVEIARWFNLPPHKLKDLSHATFSNIEHQSLEYIGDSVMPWAVDWEEECDRKLFSEFEGDHLFTEFLFDALLRSDAKTRNEAFQIQRMNGILSANEWRAKENMNPQPGEQGNVYLVPLNMTPATEYTPERYQMR